MVKNVWFILTKQNRIIYFTFRIQYCDTFRCSAAVKCIFAYIFYTFRYFYVLQIFTEHKCTLSNCFQTVGKFYACYLIFDILQCISLQERYTVMKTLLHRNMRKSMNITFLLLAKLSIIEHTTAPNENKTELQKPQ